MSNAKETIIKFLIRRDGTNPVEWEIRRRLVEACAEVAQGEECLPLCDSHSHEETCPLVNPAGAIRAALKAAERV